MPLHEIEPYVSEFIGFAQEHPEMEFNIVAIGCGLAGYKPEHIAPLFKDAPENCNLPSEFVHVLMSEQNRKGNLTSLENDPLVPFQHELRPQGTDMPPSSARQPSAPEPERDRDLELDL